MMLPITIHSSDYASINNDCGNVKLRLSTGKVCVRCLLGDGNRSMLIVLGGAVAMRLATDERVHPATRMQASRRGIMIIMGRVL
jgi:hypothetical protein